MKSNLKMDFNSNLSAVELTLSQENQSTKKQAHFLILVAMGLVIGFVNGFWGGGGGMICVPALTLFLGLPSKNAHATAILIMFPLSIVSFVVYLILGFSFNSTTFIVAVAFIVGGFLGAKLLKKINSNILKFVFGVIIIISALKIIL